MKKIIITCVIASSILISCKKDNAGMPNPVENIVDSSAQLAFRGVFANGPWGTTSGTVKIYRQLNQLSLVLDSFTVSSGPDLHVYLSKEQQPLNFIDLGVLRSTAGRQVYNITGMPDFMEYRFGLIHCQQFDHLFGSALLQ
jgi:Electron transfer DM13